MGGSPAAQKLELGSLGHPAAARWVVHGATPASFVLQPTRVSWENVWGELGHGPDGQHRAEQRKEAASLWLLNSGWALAPGCAIITMEQGKLREKKATLLCQCKARQVDQSRGQVKWGG